MPFRKGHLVVSKMVPRVCALEPGLSRFGPAPLPSCTTMGKFNLTVLSNDYGGDCSPGLASGGCIH